MEEWIFKLEYPKSSTLNLCIQFKCSPSRSWILIKKNQVQIVDSRGNFFTYYTQMDAQTCWAVLLLNS